MDAARAEGAPMFSAPIVSKPTTMGFHGKVTVYPPVLTEISPGRRHDIGRGRYGMDGGPASSSPEPSVENVGYAIAKLLLGRPGCRRGTCLFHAHARTHRFSANAAAAHGCHQKP